MSRAGDSDTGTGKRLRISTAHSVAPSSSTSTISSNPARWDPERLADYINESTSTAASEITEWVLKQQVPGSAFVKLADESEEELASILDNEHTHLAGDILTFSRRLRPYYRSTLEQRTPLVSAIPWDDRMQPRYSGSISDIEATDINVFSPNDDEQEVLEQNDGEAFWKSGQSDTEISVDIEDEDKNDNNAGGDEDEDDNDNAVGEEDEDDNDKDEVEDNDDDDSEQDDKANEAEIVVQDNSEDYGGSGNENNDDGGSTNEGGDDHVDSEGNENDDNGNQDIAALEALASGQVPTSLHPSSSNPNASQPADEEGKTSSSGYHTGMTNLLSRRPSSHFSTSSDAGSGGGLLSDGFFNEDEGNARVLSLTEQFDAIFGHLFNSCQEESPQEIVDETSSQTSSEGTAIAKMAAEDSETIRHKSSGYRIDSDIGASLLHDPTVDGDPHGQSTLSDDPEYNTDSELPALSLSPTSPVLTLLLSPVLTQDHNLMQELSPLLQISHDLPNWPSHSEPIHVVSSSQDIGLDLRIDRSRRARSLFPADSTHGKRNDHSRR